MMNRNFKDLLIIGFVSGIVAIAILLVFYGLIVRAREVREVRNDEKVTSADYNRIAVETNKKICDANERIQKLVKPCAADIKSLCIKIDIIDPSTSLSASSEAPCFPLPYTNNELHQCYIARIDNLLRIYENAVKRFIYESEQIVDKETDNYGEETTSFDQCKLKLELILKAAVFPVAKHIFGKLNCPNTICRVEKDQPQKRVIEAGDPGFALDLDHSMEMNSTSASAVVVPIRMKLSPYYSTTSHVLEEGQGR